MQTCRRNQVRISKSEIRDKHETKKIRKFKTRKGEIRRFGHLNFEHWILYRISCFEFRIFNFSERYKEVSP